MKKNICLLILLALTQIAGSQETAMLTQQANPLLSQGTILNGSENDDYAMSKFALSVNPLGFVQFGPIINAEFGITKNLVLNAHVRFSSVGMLTYVINEDPNMPDKISGAAFGGGVLYFFGEKRSKPYAGVLIDYEKDHLLYSEGEQGEWEETDKSIVFICNGGYRFRFNGGFFINTGACLGVASTQWEWGYTDPSYGGFYDDPPTGTDFAPFGMLEVTLGIEF